jgi:hypothetical protein
MPRRPDNRWIASGNPGAIRFNSRRTSAFKAIREQLGLRLKSGRSPFAVVVVDQFQNAYRQRTAEHRILLSQEAIFLLSIVDEVEHDLCLGLDGIPIQKCRGVDPLHHGVRRGALQQRMALQHFY